jgi:hypothetical protein
MVPVLRAGEGSLLGVDRSVAATAAATARDADAVAAGTGGLRDGRARRPRESPRHTLLARLHAAGWTADVEVPDGVPPLLRVVSRPLR